MFVAAGRDFVYRLPDATLIKKGRNDLPSFNFETSGKNIYGLPAF
jgi:hypothetical protein